VAEESINAISDASEFMQRDLEEFAKVVKEDSTAILSAATEASYQSINHYAGEEIAKETANYTKVNSYPKLLRPLQPVKKTKDRLPKQVLKN
jgi:hypothetical protein